ESTVVGQHGGSIRRADRTTRTPDRHRQLGRRALGRLAVGGSDRLHGRALAPSSVALAARAEPATLRGAGPPCDPVGTHLSVGDAGRPELRAGEELRPVDGTLPRRRGRTGTQTRTVVDGGRGDPRYRGRHTE